MTTESMKPYPAYKDSGIEWLGEIPEGWDLVLLKYLLLDGKDGIKIGPFGSALKSDILTSTGYKVYGQENIIKEDFSLGHRFIDDTKFNELKVHEVLGGDILITMMGTTGKSKVVPANIKMGIMDSHLIRIRNNNNSNSYFISLLINDSNYIYSQLKQNSKGSIMEGLNSSIIKSLLIACPPLEEQVRITTFVESSTTKIDTLIENKQKQIELLKEERTAIINQAVTKGLNPDVPMRDSGIEWLGDIPEHWDVAKSKYFSEIVLGKMLTPNDKGNYHKKRYLRAKNILWENVDISDVKCMWFSGNELIQYRLHLNDLIVSEGGEVGRTAIWKNELEECYIQNSVYKVTIGELHNSNYFLYQFILYGKMGHFDSIVNRVSIAHLTREKLKEVSFIAPPLSEQQSIVTFLNHQTAKIDTDIEIIQQQITLLQEYRTALISEAVTGKIDLRNQHEFPTSK